MSPPRTSPARPERSARRRRAALWGLAAVFATAAVLHFVATGAFAAIVPPPIPWPRTVVRLTGALELAFAAGLLAPPRWRRPAGVLLALYLVAVLPANVFMALTPELRLGLPASLLWLRVALQVPLIALVLWASGPRRAGAAALTSRRASRRCATAPRAPPGRSERRGAPPARP